ncbi:MAG: hypothetical protein NVS4B3_03340 [Gemmatimonadaceae bacterium]
MDLRARVASPLTIAAVMLGCRTHPALPPQPNAAGGDSAAYGAGSGAGRAAANTGGLTIDSAAMAGRNYTTMAELLQGLPGVQVIRSGQKISVRIRGSNSFLGSDDPLYVLDGMVLSTGTQETLDLIDPRDVERIEVLRDATSLAFYGSRGANGIIVIRRKRAR